MNVLKLECFHLYITEFTVEAKPKATTPTIIIIIIIHSV